MANVVEEYSWTTTKGTYKTQEAPRVYAQSYTVTNNAILQAVKTYYEAGKAVFSGGVDKFYSDMHQDAKKDVNYVFPFFTDEVRSLTNSWDNSYVSSTNGSNTGVELVGAAKAFAETSLNLANEFNALLKDEPGALFEPPKFYQYSQDEGPVTVSFVLINTAEEGDAQKNYKLVKDLIVKNRFTRKEGSPFLVSPPKLWKVIVPGYRYIRWASCDVAISLLGTRRMVGSDIIPEGYNISLSFKPLYTEPSNYESKYSSRG
jgi:hypothetical protein